MVRIWGLTLTGDRPIADDGIELFVSHAARSGAVGFELADPLNDIRNLEAAAAAGRRARRRLVGVLVHANGPAQDAGVWPALGRGLRDLGVAEIAIEGPGLGRRAGAAVGEAVARATGLEVSVRNTSAIEVPDEAAAEVARIQEELGFPPLAGPVGRMVISQAELNREAPNRYQTLSPGLKDYLQGLHGRPPGKVSKELRTAILGSDEPVTLRPGELLRPVFGKGRAGGRRSQAGLDGGRLLIHMLYPQMPGGDSRSDRDEKSRAPDATPASESPSPPAPAAPSTAEYEVEVDGEVFRVRVTGTAAAAGVQPSGPPLQPVAARPAPPTSQTAVVAPMQGLIVKIPVKPGDEVRLGDVVAVLEAMKMHNDIVTTVAGKVAQVYVAEGEVVSPNQPLVGIA